MLSIFLVLQVAVKHVAKTKVGEWTEVSWFILLHYTVGNSVLGYNCAIYAALYSSAC